MYFVNSLNSQSRALVNNIYINAKRHPWYASYDIVEDDMSYSNGGAVAIKVSRESRIVNMFLFFPSEDNSGRIGSVAIYGNQLSGHKQAIEHSMQLFGLPVDSVDWNQGYERYLDVTLKAYTV